MNDERTLHKLKHLEQENMQRLKTLHDLGIGQIDPFQMLQLRLDFMAFEMAEKWGQRWALESRLRWEEMMNELLTQAVNASEADEEPPQQQLWTPTPAKGEPESETVGP